MANARKLYDTQRLWMIGKLIATTADSNGAFANAFKEEVESELRDLAKIHNPEANATEVLKIKTQKSAHEKLRAFEEKTTKLLFVNISTWLQRNIAVQEYNSLKAQLLKDGEEVR